MKKITANFLKVTQPIGEFYCCVMKARDLYSISYSDVRRLEEEQSEDNIDTYLGIQRELNKSRVKKIREYIGSVDATFPNSIIVAIDGDFLEINDNEITIKFEDYQSGKIAKILDGQHRLAGFEETDFSFISQYDEKVDFEVLVTIFVEADLHTQAQVFTMVNQNQTKVNKSLVYDLESLALARNPSKTAHQIAVILNSREGSPFFRRIKRLGVKTIGVDSEVLTQAAFVDNVVKLISKRPSLDRDILLGKKKNFIGIKNMQLPDNNNASFRALPFRKNFINSDDSTIAVVLHNFFSVVSELWPNAWDSKNRKSVLNKTVGFISLIRLLRDVYNIYVDEGIIKYGDIIDKDLFYSKLKEIDLDDSYFETVDAVSKSSGYVYKIMKNFIS
ncbi:DGQHR domain-containing protein [Citrobacter freundii]|uniref:DGQHR domain-containing protein n=1 Tax=Citrobacter freundii TaxID=546 RepID=UPI0023595CB5|nr:DGQHR domain-containing protein [Citrobacter freundii]MDC8906630.1 DGQHR domain-containing protein [Citrobacter freundii]MDH0404512.1 DGQHR domain-containing protein [Citrobacter freundii]